MRGERALADSDRAGHSDDVRNLRGTRSEKRGGHLVQALRRTDVEVQQSAEWEVHGGDLVEIDAFVDAAQPIELGLAQRERRGRTQVGPCVAVERQVS